MSSTDDCNEKPDAVFGRSCSDDFVTPASKQSAGLCPQKRTRTDCDEQVTGSDPVSQSPSPTPHDRLGLHSPRKLDFDTGAVLACEVTGYAEEEEEEEEERVETTQPYISGEPGLEEGEIPSSQCNAVEDV